MVKAVLLTGVLFALLAFPVIGSTYVLPLTEPIPTSSEASRSSADLEKLTFCPETNSYQIWFGGKQSHVDQYNVRLKVDAGEKHAQVFPGDRHYTIVFPSVASLKTVLQQECK